MMIHIQNLFVFRCVVQDMWKKGHQMRRKDREVKWSEYNQTDHVYMYRSCIYVMYAGLRFMTPHFHTSFRWPLEWKKKGIISLCISIVMMSEYSSQKEQFNITNSGNNFPFKIAIYILTSLGITNILLETGKMGVFVPLI